MSGRIRNGQAGQAIALVAILLVVLIGFVGLAVDSGRGYLVRRTLQNATDSAVLATADYFENGYSVTNAEKQAAAIFEKNERIYGGISGSPSWCSTPNGGTPAPTCSVTVNFNSSTQSLTLGYTDNRGVGRGLIFTATGNDTMSLAFLQVLGSGSSINVSAQAQTVVYDQSQNPAILVTGTSCPPQASLGISGGVSVVVVGAVYSDGGIKVSGSASVNVTGNVYASCSQSTPISGISQSAGYTESTGVGTIAVNYAGGVNSPYYPYYSGNSESWPASNVEVSPGVYNSNPNITGSNCNFLDPGIYNWPGGYKDNGGLISNELRPPDEAVYNNMAQRAGSGNNYIQFWRNTVTCDGSFSVATVNAGGGNGVSQGTWGVVVTSAREDPFNPTYPSGSTVYYPRGSAPSMCRSVSVNNSGNQGFQVAVSNVPGAEWYNVYAYLGGCPADANYSRFGYIGSVCSGQGALSAASHTFSAVAGCSSAFTQNNSGTCPALPAWPNGNGSLTSGPGNNSSCGLGYTVSPVYTSALLGGVTGGTGSYCPTTPAVGAPDYPGSGGVSRGCEPPDSEVCPTIVGGCAPTNTSPMPPNDPAAQNSGSTPGDRADENECADQSGNFMTCPGNVTPGAVQFSFPNVNGACFDDEGNGGAWVFSGRQYDYIAVYSLVTTSTCSGNNGNKIAGGGATSWIGTTYFPNAYLTVTGSSKAPISGQVVANNLTIDGSAGVTVDYNPNLAPTPPGGRLIL